MTLLNVLHFKVYLLFIAVSNKILQGRSLFLIVRSLFHVIHTPVTHSVNIWHVLHYHKTLLVFTLGVFWLHYHICGDRLQNTLTVHSCSLFIWDCVGNYLSAFLWTCVYFSVHKPQFVRRISHTTMITILSLFDILHILPLTFIMFNFIQWTQVAFDASH